MLNPGPHSAILFDVETSRWRYFHAPLEIVTANRLEDVLPALERVESAVNNRGVHAVGFVSYEASEAFDPALAVTTADDFPLLWFGLYASSETIELPSAEAIEELDWSPQLTEAAFLPTIATIREAIARGETYQVNFTFPMTAKAPAAPWNFFLRLVQGQKSGEAAWLDTGRYTLCSASPELFFALDGEELISRPMKGTAPRGLTRDDDLAKAAVLQASEKDRAENVMILDMIRNDLGRLPGGPVRVVEEFAIEQYPTVWQMTSTAATRTDAPVSEIFRALFPCASITGAPKVRTMQIIRDLEQRPRRIYTGAIGHISPNRKARFSVAIRTALIDRETETAEYPVGAGITWGSDPQSEYRECLLKARILTSPQPDFELLETLLWTPQEGYALRDEHLDRLERSAGYFDIPCRREAISAHLEEATQLLPAAPHKLRLLVKPQGDFRSETSMIELPEETPLLRVALADNPLNSCDPFLYHKTTHRQVYQSAQESRPDLDEVLLWNELGELTEACNYNLVIEKDGQFLTPPVSSGLLAGTLRAKLLADGELHTVALTKEDLINCDNIWLINSVRGWRKAVLVEG